ncbi:ATP-dependent Clp protease adapter ClpS [Leptothrix ochracea]|nr:ATP-dependent Clp protease adapter ClpS [Leptothrix ochracea]
MLAADPPPVYKVVLINDDFTPMEFVIFILQHFFHLNLDESTRIMLKIHHEGRGICGVYSKDVALTKVDQVSMAAKNAGHPLQCIMEAE